MKKSHVFSPALSDQLETRSVPSTLTLPGAHAAVVVGPVVHLPGTFSQGDQSPILVASTGEKFKLNAITVAPHAASTATPAATIKATIVTPPPVVHLPGTFSQGDQPPFFVAPTGEKFKLN
jgi:hypothetical protein